MLRQLCKLHFLNNRRRPWWCTSTRPCHGSQYKEATHQSWSGGPSAVTWRGLSPVLQGARSFLNNDTWLAKGWIAVFRITAVQRNNRVYCRQLWAPLVMGKRPHQRKVQRFRHWLRNHKLITRAFVLRINSNADSTFAVSDRPYRRSPIAHWPVPQRWPLIITSSVSGAQK